MTDRIRGKRISSLFPRALSANIVTRRKAGLINVHNLFLSVQQKTDRTVAMIIHQGYQLRHAINKRNELDSTVFFVCEKRTNNEIDIAEFHFDLESRTLLKRKKEENLAF